MAIFHLSSSGGNGARNAEVSPLSAVPVRACNGGNGLISVVVHTPILLNISSFTILAATT